jgi:NodT family efflux transporter outer membrane factor (OMF) lipoprotein
VDRRTSRSKAWLASFLALLMALQPGCTSLRQYVGNGFKVGSNYLRPPAPVAGAWIDMDDPRVKSDPPADCAWWTVFNDPVLNGLVEQAYRQNLDLRAAGTRIVEARARRGIAVGSLFPQQQTADVTYLHAQISENLAIPLPTQFNLWAAGFNGSWELDIWGRYRRSIEAADAVLAESVEGYGEVLVLLLSDVAANYIELRTFQQRLAYAQMNVEIQKGSLKLAEARFSRGASTELDVRQARSSLQRTQAVVPTYEASAREAANALCVLLGMPPSDLAEALGPAPIPTAPVEVALGIPADLLARRPDVRRAERAVAQQSARLGIAQTDLYPSLTLNGYMGFMSNDIEQLFESTSFTGYILPQFSWNVLNYGRISNNIIAQDAKLQGVAFDYQQTVLKAGREVEDSLTRFLHAQQRAKFLRGSVADAIRAVELAELQFKGGTTDFNRVYNLQSLLAQQQDELAAVEGSIALNLVAVYKSLGGGWRCFLYCQGMPAPTHDMQAIPAADEPAINSGPEPLPPPIPVPSATTSAAADSVAANSSAARPSSRRAAKTEGKLAKQEAKPEADKAFRPDRMPRNVKEAVGSENPFLRTPSEPEATATKQAATTNEASSSNSRAAMPAEQPAKKPRPRIGIGELFARSTRQTRDAAVSTTAASGPEKSASRKPLPPPLPLPAAAPMHSAAVSPPAAVPPTSENRPSSRRVVKPDLRVSEKSEPKKYQHEPLAGAIPKAPARTVNNVAKQSVQQPTVRPLSSPQATKSTPVDPRPSSRRVITPEERLSAKPRAGVENSTSVSSDPVVDSQKPNTSSKRPTASAAVRTIDPRPSSRRVVSPEERLSGKPRPDLDQRKSLDRSPQSVPKTTVGNHDPRFASQTGHEGGIGLVERH